MFAFQVLLYDIQCVKGTKTREYFTPKIAKFGTVLYNNDSTYFLNIIPGCHTHNGLISVQLPVLA